MCGDRATTVQPCSVGSKRISPLLRVEQYRIARLREEDVGVKHDHKRVHARQYKSRERAQ